jgi:hypothetical protein
VARIIHYVEHPKGNQLLARKEEHGLKGPKSREDDPKLDDLLLSKVKCG